jgi:hypothetical protein
MHIKVLHDDKAAGIDAETGLAAAIAAVICGEMEVAPAKPSTVLPAGKIAEIDVGSKFAAAVTTAIYSYLEEHAPSYQAGRIKITSIQPSAVVAQSNWQLAGRISLLDSRSNFLKLRRRYV